LTELDNLAKIPDNFSDYLKMTNPTLTSQIFNLSAPYDNPYQGSRRRILFVCSAGLLRSPTGASVGSVRGYNTRAAGSNQRYALVPLSVNLIEWAQTIVFVNQENLQQALETFDAVGYGDDLERKSVALDIPDRYPAFHPQLIDLFNEFFDRAEACNWQFAQKDMH
jgi:predicted protein tyrosine phosphatase